MKMYRGVIDKEKALRGFEEFVHLEGGEKWILFCDDTIMGSGKEGAVLTDRRVIKFEKADLRSFPIAGIRAIDRMILSGKPASGITLITNSGKEEKLFLAGIQDVDIDEFVTQAKILVGAGGPPAASAAPAGDLAAAAPVAAAPAVGQPASLACVHVEKGKPCTIARMPGSQFCWEHLPQAEKVALLDNLKAKLASTGGLAGENLPGIDLTSFELRNKNLSAARLPGANMAGMDLGGTDLSGANLEHAKLRKANLTAADLSRASLAGANMRSSTIDGTRLAGATGLDTAEFNGAYLGDLAGVPADEVEAMKVSAAKVDLKAIFTIFLGVFAGIFALLGMLIAFVQVALPLGFKGIVVFLVVGWELSGGVGALIGTAIGAAAGILPAYLIALMLKGKRSHHAAGSV